VRPFNDCGHGIFAQPDLATNQSVATSVFDLRENPRRQTVGLWSLPFLPAETFAGRFRRRYSIDRANAGEGTGSPPAFSHGRPDWSLSRYLELSPIVTPINAPADAAVMTPINTTPVAVPDLLDSSAFEVFRRGDAGFQF
jgi:hypothetical protein